MARPLSFSEALPAIGRVSRHFMPHLAPHRRLVIGSMIALFGGVLFRLLEPWPLKYVFDRLFRAKGQRFTGLPLIDQLDAVTLLSAAAISIVLIALLRALADYWNSIGFALIGNRVLTEIRSKLYQHLQCLSLSFHSQARGGDLLVRVIGDVNMLKEIAVTAILPLLANVLVLAGMLGLMLWLNWRLALLGLAILPLSFLFTLRASRRIHKVARDQRKREGAMAATAAESIGGIKVVQTLSLESAFSQSFSKQNKKSLMEGVQGSRLSAALERRVDVLIAIATALVVWQGAWLVMSGSMTPGDLIVFLTYLKRAFTPLKDFAKYTGRLAKGAAAGERVVDLLEREPEIQDPPNAIVAPPFRGTVRFEDVSFAYDSELIVFEHVDFEVPAGRHVAIAGASGVGKSTLVGLIPRLYDVTGGRVLIDGRDVREFTLASLRSQISVLLQETLLFAANIRDNIAYGAPDVDAAEVEAAARLANAHGFIEEMPEGYETIVGERGVTLSNGQRQRIAIARAAIRQSPILILDEPTTGLDEENQRDVIEALERLSQGRTTFLITHDLRTASRCDMIVLLHNRRIVERGSHEELMRAQGRYAMLFDLEASENHVRVAEEGSIAVTR
jgi:ATP-binding cassette, subfamily B, bacterial